MHSCEHDFYSFCCALDHLMWFSVLCAPALSCVGLSRCISHPLLHISVWRRSSRLLSGGGARPVHLWGRNHLLGETLPHFHWWDKRIDEERLRERTRQVWLWWYLMTHGAQAHFNQHKSYFIMLPSPPSAARGLSRQRRPIGTAVTVMRIQCDWLLKCLVKASSLWPVFSICCGC